jgi:CDGSH-type Zn-finger protein
MPAKINIRNNGFFRVEGDFEIFDQEGKKYELAGRESVSLCRCGASETKPFCDGTHRKINFQSECHAYALEPLKSKQ